MRNNLKVIVFLVIILTWAGQLPADEFQIIPSLAVREEYDDNIFYSSSDKEDDFVTTVAGKLELIERTERLHLNLSGRVAPFWYADNSDLDEVDQDYRGRISYQLTPRTIGRSDGYFIIDHRPDRDIVSTGLAQNVDKRDRYHFGAGVNHMLSEVLAADLSYDYNRDDWDRAVIDQEDYKGHIVNLGFTYDMARWLEPTKGLLNFSYGNYKYDSSETDSFAGLIGAQHWFSETVNLTVNAGARYVDSDFKVPQLRFVPPASFRIDTVNESNSGWGGVGRAVLEYRGEKARSNILVSHDMSPASGRLGPTVLTRAIFNLNYTPLEKLRLGLSGGYYRNRSDSGDFSAQDIDEDTYRIWPTISWEFYKNFSLEGGYYFTYLDDNEHDTTTKRHRVFLQLAYGLPLLDVFDFSAPEIRQIVDSTVPLPEPR